MENRLLGGGGADMLLLWPGSKQQWQKGGSCILQLQYHTLPTPNALRILGGDAKRAEPHAVCWRHKKVVINKGKKIGLRIQIRLEAKFHFFEGKGLNIIQNLEDSNNRRRPAA